MVLLAAALMSLAGLCPAADLDVSGSVAAGFGWLRDAEADRRGPAATGEATLHLAASAPNVRAAVEATLAEGDSALEDAEHEVVWLPPGGLSITLSGSAFNIEAMENVTSVINAPEGTVGDDDVHPDASGSGLLDVAYTGDGFTLGAAMLDRCVPRCGYGLVADDTEPPDPDRGQASAILHLHGETPSFLYHAYVARSAGEFATPQVRGHGTGGGGGLQYGSDEARIGLDASYTVVRCLPDVGDAPCSVDQRQARAATAVWLHGFAIRHFEGRLHADDGVWRTRSTDLAYLTAFNDAAIGPEYRHRTIEAPQARALTDSYLLLGMSLEF